MVIHSCDFVCETACRRCSTDLEDAHHSCLRVPGHGAEIAVRAFLLEVDDELRRLPGPDQGRLLAVDLEVVRNVADVRVGERDLARLCGRPGGEPEEELAA